MNKRLNHIDFAHHFVVANALSMSNIQMDRPRKRIKTDDVVEDAIEGTRSNSTEDEPNLDFMQDLYMETVDRSQLDFDQERLCSVTLSNLNVYACLVCGKYFAGRSKTTPAFFHALEVDHHVFLNLATLRAYVLPDMYENTNKALDDIKYAVSPVYTKEDVKMLDKDASMHHDLARTLYRPGFVGMNTLKGGDHIGVVIHALSHVSPIRNFFLLEDVSSKTEMVQSFSLLLRKLWSVRLFKAHISPHEFVRRVTLKPRLSSGSKEPQEFITSLLNAFHVQLGGSKLHPSIISACFQGQLLVETQKVYQVTESSANDRLRFESDHTISGKTSQFMLLTLDLPPTPLFQNDVQRNIIPQVSLVELLGKYNGVQVQEFAGDRRRYTLTKLPPYLLLNIKRFTHTDFATEKNPTIVNFPLRSLDMAPFLAAGVDVEPQGTIYDLLVNVSHESVFNSVGDESHIYRTQIRDKACDKWIQMEGLFVQEIKKDVISIGESVLQIWERRKQ